MCHSKTKPARNFRQIIAGTIPLPFGESWRGAAAVLCFLSFLFLTSCNEKESWFKNTDLKGTVLDTTTGTPIADVTVTLKRDVPRGIFSESNFTSMTTKTDAEGHFRIKFRDKRFSYVVIFEKQDYYFENGINLGGSVKNKEHNHTVYMHPQAKLRIHIKNDNPDNQDNGVYVEIYTIYNNGVGNYTNINGSNIDTYFSRTVKGNKYNKFLWSIEKNNKITRHNDSIYCPSFITTTYELNY